MAAAQRSDQEDGLLVIGAGFGRTGTASLKSALEMLLGAKCYHMTGFPEFEHSLFLTLSLSLCLSLSLYLSISLYLSLSLSVCLSLSLSLSLSLPPLFILLSLGKQELLISFSHTHTHTTTEVIANDKKTNGMHTKVWHDIGTGKLPVVSFHFFF